MFTQLLKQAPSNLKPLSSEALLQAKADAINAQPGTLGGGDCALCLNRGYTARPSGGVLVCTECACMARRRSMRLLERSGLAGQVRRCTLHSFSAELPWQAEMKRTALAYLAEPNGWLVLSGHSGSGKTHLCTAVCGELLRRGVPVRCLQWRADAPGLKAAVNDGYSAAMEPYRRVRCLYIDDFWKGAVSEADVKLSFDLLNSRYNDTRLLTILSSEKSIEEILRVDEAVGGRIYERSRGYYVKLGGADKNWRLHGG